MLSRYITREIALPFSVWLVLLCMSFFLMAILKGAEFLLGSAVSLFDLGRFVVYLSPQFLIQSLPISLLLSVVFGLSRLAEDREVQAMQALGVSPLVLIRSALLPGFLVTALVTLLTVYAQPWGQKMVRLTANDIIRKNLMHDVKSGTFHNEVFGLMLYIEKVQGLDWVHVLIHDARDEERPLLVTAGSGKIGSASLDDAVMFALDRGTIHRVSAGDDYTVLDFETADMRASIVETIHRKNQFQSRDEQGILELHRTIEAAELTQDDVHPLQVTLYWRLGQLLMSLAFALVGAPLALMRRLPRGVPLLVSLGAYFGFYFLARVSMQLADSGALAPVWAGAIPVLFFLGAGLLLSLFAFRRGLA
jgi:lipopolysaccharide export system permease protein